MSGGRYLFWHASVMGGCVTGSIGLADPWLPFRVGITQRTGQARETQGQDRVLGRPSEARERKYGDATRCRLHNVTVVRRRQAHAVNHWSIRAMHSSSNAWAAASSGVRSVPLEWQSASTCSTGRWRRGAESSKLCRRCCPLRNNVRASARERETLLFTLCETPTTICSSRIGCRLVKVSMVTLRRSALSEDMAVLLSGAGIRAIL